MLQPPAEESLEFSCLICLVRDDLINTNATDSNNVEWKSKLSYCVPEIDWNIICYLCQLCAGQLDLLCAFRTQCVTSYFNRFKPITHKETNSILPIQETTIEVRSDSKVIYKENFDTQTQEDAHPLSEPTFTCYHCSQTFHEKPRLIEHIKSDHETISYTCELCLGVYTTRKKLEIHKVDCGTNKKKQIRCEQCGSGFSTKYLFNRHVRNVHATEKKHKCEICGQKFASSVYLKAHKKYHSGNRSHICSFCGKGYITASDLYHHEKIHANKRAYKCDKCPKAFNTSSDLHKHRICVHMDRSLWKYSCSYCGRRFPLKTNLDSHTKTHTGEKNYVCHLCDRRCISQSVLQRHIQSHSNVRSYKCTHCNQEYKYQKSLNVHLKKAHGIGDVKLPERVKKYFCHICPKSYFANNKLQKHIRSHTGERPFGCELCEKKFVDKSYVKQHLKTAHNVVLPVNT